MDREAWHAASHGVTKSQTQLGDWTNCDRMGDSSPGSAIRGIFQTRILEWVAISYSRDLPNPGIDPASPALAGRFFTTVTLGKPLIEMYHYSKFSCIIWWFDICIYWEMITKISLVNIYQSPHTVNFFSLVMRNLKIYSFRDFCIYNIILLTIVTMLYITLPRTYLSYNC